MKDKKNIRANKIEVLLTDAELERYRNFATSLGMSMATYARMLIVTACRGDQSGRAQDFADTLRRNL